MKSSSLKLGAELALIFLLSAAAGIAWNHQLLSDAWSGKAVQASQKSAPSTQQGTTPLPLGLMQVKELYDRKEALIVDARDNPSFAAGHISGALSLPLGEADAGLAAFRAKAPPTATIVVYCNGFDCPDSMDLGSRLLGAGYRKVFVFLGGYPEWRDAGYPIAEGTP
jgi:rhodanese-related sulfurtransferase